MISIIIPVYNTEQFLCRCVDSVLHQTVTDWELILVDDGSTDSSGQLCDEYAARDTRIKTIHQQNSGPAAARSRGIEHANGEWIAFADSDDCLDERAFAILLREQGISNADMVCTRFANVKHDGKIIYPKRFKPDVIECHSALEAMYQIHETRLLEGSLVAKLIRKALFTEIDFCSRVTIGEDYSLTLQLAEKAQTIRLIQDCIYYRYIRKGSISHAGYTERHREAFDNYMEKRQYLIEKYPELEEAITGFHTEYEMAVVTAMCRNKANDQITIDKLKKDLRMHMHWTWENSRIPLYMKICAWMIAYPTKTFMCLFRILYLCTGR